MRKHYNPERRDWKGRSYKRGGKRIQQLKEIQCQTCGEFRTEAEYEAHVLVCMSPSDAKAELAHFFGADAEEADEADEADPMGAPFQHTEAGDR